jgi:hypothetical protein
VPDNLLELLEFFQCPDCDELRFHKFGPNPKPEAVKCWSERAAEHLTHYHQKRLSPSCVEEGCMESKPPKRDIEQPETLESLVSRITPENRHPAVDWGPDVGKERLPFEDETQFPIRHPAR